MTFENSHQTQPTESARESLHPCHINAQVVSIELFCVKVTFQRLFHSEIQIATKNHLYKSLLSSSLRVFELKKDILID